MWQWLTSDRVAARLYPYAAPDDDSRLGTSTGTEGVPDLRAAHRPGVAPTTGSVGRSKRGALAPGQLPRSGTCGRVDNHRTPTTTDHELGGGSSVQAAPFQLSMSIVGVVFPSVVVPTATQSFACPQDSSNRMLNCPDLEVGFGMGRRLQLDPFHNCETAGNPASEGVGPPRRAIAQVDDQTTKQCDGDVHASADVDSERSRPNGRGAAAIDHDVPFQRSTMIRVGIGRASFSTVPRARQNELDVQETLCKDAAPFTGGVVISFHCDPSQPSASAGALVPTLF
jgi:hypothetical protein